MTLANAGLVTAQQPVTYNLTLLNAEVSNEADGWTVVTLIARGDLPGTLTLALNRSANGSVTEGEWALMVSYTSLTSPDGVTGETDGHHEALVQKGVLKGDVTGGSLTFNADGSLHALNDIFLTVTGGTLEYARTTSGNGVVNGTYLADRDASNGVASILF